MLSGMSPCRAQSASLGISVCSGAVCVLFIFLVNNCEPRSEKKRNRYYGILLYFWIITRVDHTYSTHIGAVVNGTGTIKYAWVIFFFFFLLSVLTLRNITCIIAYIDTCNFWSSGTWSVSRKHHNSDADHTTHNITI